MLSTQSPKGLFITAIIDGIFYSKCSLNKIIGELFRPRSKQFPKPVHHIGFMLHQRMSIAIECNGRVFMPEDLGKRFYIHAAFEGAGGERMPQRMKAFVRYF